VAYIQFKDCVIDGVNVVEAWLREQPEDIQAEFLVLLDRFEKVPVENWRQLRRNTKGEDRGYKKLHGEHAVLREFSVDKEGHYRLAAYRGPADSEMTLLSGWIHSSDGAQKVGLELAMARREMLREGKAERVDHVT